MTRPCSILLLAGLGACASSSFAPRSGCAAPTVTGMLPAEPSGSQGVEPAGGAPEQSTMPLGVGVTAGPSTTLLATTLDFPIDTNLTFGPSFQYGFDDKVDLTTLTGQAKYFLPTVGTGSGSFSVLPYLTGGVGVASIDKEGLGRDSGLVVNLGGGMRYLTGEHYRLGSEVRVNLLADKLDGESAFLSFDLLQVVLSF